MSYEVASTNVSSLQRAKVTFRVVVVGNSAGRRRKRTSRVECGDDRAFRHMLTFSLAYARDVGAILDGRLDGGVENFAQPFINVNAAGRILIIEAALMRGRKGQGRI